MRTIFKQIKKNNWGQTTVEYILLLAVVALIIFRFKETASTKLTELTNSVFSRAGSILNE